MNEVQSLEANASAQDGDGVRHIANVVRSSDDSDGSTTEVTYSVVPKTKYVIWRSYIRRHENGRADGGSSIHGEFETAEEAERVMRILAERR